MSLRAASRTDITPLLTRWSRGNREALDRVLPLVYGELRKIAARQLRKEGDGHPLDPSDLVHALFVQLVDQRYATWSNRAQFYATTAQMMRRILVDTARARHAAKRGGAVVTVSLTALAAEPTSRPALASDVLAIDDALERLAEHDLDQARIVEMRFFAGLSVEEVAHVMGVSARTIKRQWRMARAWLFRELQRSRAEAGPRAGPP
jgi:RNA polymerase sigma factor (TIGR02999 family)